MAGSWAGGCPDPAFARLPLASQVAVHPISIGLVALGGALGAIARFWLSGFIARRVGETFPWGTLAVNFSGAAAIGLLAGALLGSSALAAASPLWLTLATGILGSYTTVSSFSLQTLSLARAGEWRSAAWNIVASLALCLGAASLGFLAALLVIRT